MKETKDVRCENCKGTGIVSERESCYVCNGWGKIGCIVDDYEKHLIYDKELGSIGIAGEVFNCGYFEHHPSLPSLNQRFPNVNQNLEILAEECAEVIQIKSKIARFGLNDHHPKNKIPNGESLEQELGDVLAMIDILISNGVISQANLDTAKQKKIDKLSKYYNYNNGQYVNKITPWCEEHIKDEGERFKCTMSTSSGCRGPKGEAGYVND